MRVTTGMQALVAPRRRQCHRSRVLLNVGGGHRGAAQTSAGLPHCGFKASARYDLRTRPSQWRRLDLGVWRVEVRATLRRLRCPSHPVVTMSAVIAPPWAGRSGPWIPRSGGPRTSRRVARGGRRRRVGRVDLLVDLSADLRHRRTRHSGLAAQRPHEVVDLARRGARHVRGHDHRPQRPIDPAARFEQAREKRPHPYLRDPQLDVARRRRQQPAPGSSARCPTEMSFEIRSEERTVADEIVAPLNWLSIELGVTLLRSCQRAVARHQRSASTWQTRC